MTTRIVIKNSTVAGKVPAASDLVNAELAVNLVDQKLYSKDASGTVFEIGSTVGSGNNPPGSGNEIGDLWWDGDVLLVWNGSDWEIVGGVTSVNGETGEVELDLGDLNDVIFSPLNNGDIIAWNGTAWINTAAPPADISGSSINDLNDVDTNGVDDGDILIWNQAAGEWQATDRGTVPEKTSDLTNDGENGTDPFITEAEVNNILEGNKPDGTPDPGAPGYLKPGDNVSELTNDAGYLTDAVTKIIAGTNITIDPATGEGEVTINAADAAALALDDLTDVNVPSPDSGDVLSYNGTNWVSSAAPPADISGSNLTQLNDVEAAGAADGDMLIYDGGNAEWVNTPAPTKTSDFENDGNGDAGEVFITTGEVTNILNGLNPDGTPDAGNPGYLKPGDNVSELNNDAGYLTSADTAGDSDKLGGQDPDYYLNYQNFTNIPPTVDKIIAGTGVSIDPASGQGEVTINSTVSSTEFVGPVDVTSSVVPAQVRSANALYVNTGVGKFSPEWAAVTTNADVNTEANPGDFMMKDLDSSASDPWTWIEAGTPPASDGLWVEAGGKLSPATLANDVLVGGADATAATIQLNASGSASFASTVSVGNDPFPGTATGSALYSDGSIALSSADSTGTIFFGYTTGNSTPTTLIKGDGSAKFAGPISPGDAEAGMAIVTGSLPALVPTSKTSIGATRTIDIGTPDRQWNTIYGVKGDFGMDDTDFQKGVRCSSDNVGSSFVSVYGTGDSTKTAFQVYDGVVDEHAFRVFHDGSAFFRGKVNVVKYNTDSDTLLCQYKVEAADGARQSSFQYTTGGDLLLNGNSSDPTPNVTMNANSGVITARGYSLSQLAEL